MANKARHTLLVGCIVGLSVFKARLKIAIVLLGGYNEIMDVKCLAHSIYLRISHPVFNEHLLHDRHGSRSWGALVRWGGVGVGQVCTVEEAAAYCLWTLGELLNSSLPRFFL